MAKQKRIFISYGRDEFVELATRLKTDLEAQGYEIWFDQDRIKPGDDWEKCIEEGIDWISQDPRSGIVVLLMTPHSVGRPDGYCLNEIARALQRKLRIVPIMVVRCEAPLSICRYQWIDMADCIPLRDRSDHYNHKFNSLLRVLEEEKTGIEGWQTRLYNVLQPLDFKAEIAEHIPHFTGREWVFGKINKWLFDPRAPRIFWILGDPGSGKTAIASYLCHKRPEVKALHLCRFKHDDKSDPRRCVMSLAYQLSTQFQNYQKRLTELNLEEEIKKSATTIFDNLVVQPLTTQTHIPSSISLIVIDALDEASKNGKNELAEFIAKEFLQTPPWLRLIITSRQEPEVMQPLQGLAPYHLNTDLPENVEDIRNYLKNNIRPFLDDKAHEDDIIETLVRKSEGIFLYAEQVISDLKAGQFSLSRREEFPQGLGGKFLIFFKRTFSDTDAYRENYRPLLEMIIAAKGPLPIDLSQTALKWNDYTCNEALARIGSIFPQEKQHIQPFHRAIVDWLTNPDKSGPYFTNITEGQKRLVDACWTEYKTGIKGMSEYSLEYLPGHLVELARWEDLLNLVLSPELGLVERWIERGEGEKVINSLTALVNYLEKNKHQLLTSAGLATQIARVLSLWGQYDDAERWLKYALRFSTWHRGRRVKAVALHELGSLFLYQHNLAKAKHFYRQAMIYCLFGSPPYHDEAAANMIGLATVSKTMCRFTETIRYSRKAIKKAHMAGDIQHIIAGERLLSYAYKTIGNYQEAEMHIQTALLICEKYGLYLEKARLLLLLGWLQYDKSTLARELPTESKAHFNKAKSEAQKIHNLYCLIEAKLSLGVCALAEKSTEEARNWFRPLSELLPPGRHPELKAAIDAGMAAVAHQNGNKEEARKLYRQVISFCQKHDIRQWSCKAMVGFGSLEWHSGKTNQAENLWKQALKTAKSISKARSQLIQMSIELCQKDPLAAPR